MSLTFPETKFNYDSLDLIKCLWRQGYSAYAIASPVGGKVHDTLSCLGNLGEITIHEDYRLSNYDGYGGLTKASFKKSQLFKGKPYHKGKDFTLSVNGKQLEGVVDVKTIMFPTGIMGQWIPIVPEDATANKKVALKHLARFKVNKPQEGVDMSRTNVKVETEQQEAIRNWIDGESITYSNTLVEETLKFNNSGVNNMPQRATVTVELWDDSKGIDAVDSLVFSTKVITEDSDQVVIQQVLLEKNVKKKIAQHNNERTFLLNEDILERTGNEVTFGKVKLKDLRWSVKR